ncbi:MAG TPA: hypothetical protein VMH82_04095 [Myxococcota bacterium]|nr:hypothetical protein [Myxococcota bacterium]
MCRSRRPRPALRSALIAAAAAALACASGAPTGSPRTADKAKEAEPFPSRDELGRLSDRPLPATPAPDLVRVDSWDLAGPFPERVGEEPITNPDAWEQLLIEAASQRAGLVVASESMRCAARELGRFHVERGGQPDPGLQSFLLSRCGATGVQVEFGSLRGTVAPGESDAALLARWHEQAVVLLRDHLGAGARAVGIWFGRHGDEAVLLLASSQRRVHLEPVSAVPDADGNVVLRGEVLIPAQSIDGLVNQGRYRVTACQADPSVHLPRFAFRCPTEKDDESAWISLMARPPGRVLGEDVLDVLARPGGQPVASYRRPRYGRSASIASKEEFSKRLLVELNRVRQQADAPPLALEPKESEVAERLASPYFGSYLGTADPALGDVAALGLMAGWDVSGTIRDAGVGGALVIGTSDIEAWLAQALEQPNVRSTLLDPARSRLAVGPIVSPKDEYLAAMVATYALYGGADPSAELEAFRTHLDRAYAARNLPAPIDDPDVGAVAARHVANVQSGTRTPDVALRELLAEAGARVHAPVRGWVLEGASPDDVALPDEIFEQGVRRVAAAVGYYRPAGSAWGRTLVLLVILPEGSLRSVERAPRPALGS